MALRLGLLVTQDAPYEALVERWRTAEELGFDHLWVADHTADYRDLDGSWLDGWTLLAAMALETTAIRIGTLVTNPIIRPPVLAAKAAITVDHLSGGRLELGIGTGIAGFDHQAMGIDYWQPEERGARYAEYVEIVHGILSAAGGRYTFEGRYYRTSTPTAPGPAQQPRPPITVGGQSARARGVAARLADCWNTHGPFGKTAAEILETTRRQSAELDEACRAAGRDPSELRRSLLLLGALDPWAGGPPAEETISRFRDARMEEFVLAWPPEERTRELEALVSGARGS